jgi:acyl-CoA synthetase (AMP-forming)/AMP-acid ligase II
MNIAGARSSLTVVGDAKVELLSSEVSHVMSQRIVAAFAQRGIQPRSFVVFQSANSAHLLAGIYGALLGGYAAVVISEKLSDREVNDMLEDLPHSLVVSAEMLEEFAKSNQPDSTGLSQRFCSRPVHFTSGTSGKPKGVWSGWLTSDDADALASEERDAWHLAKADVHLVNGPLSHSAPLRFALHTLLNGGMVLVPPRFDVENVIAIIESGLATTTFMVPVHLQRILDTRPPKRSSMRLVAHAGSSCADRVRLAAIEAFGVDALVEFYGSTEGQFTLCRAAEWREHRGTVGRARPGRELNIDKGGRIWCRVPPYARFEYWGDPEKSSAAWRGDWLTVGDVGRLDELGYLYLEGRRTDLIISGGVNVYPAEIERVLSELPSIVSVVAFGIDDPQWGQRVCVAYVGNVSDGEVLQYCHDNLAPYKHPKSIVKVTELPRTHTGKINRSALANLVRD